MKKGALRTGVGDGEESQHSEGKRREKGRIWQGTGEGDVLLSPPKR